MENSTDNKLKPRLLGEYLSCSRGSIRIAMQKKRDAKIRGKQKRLGDILVELNVIKKEELIDALYRQRADHLGLCSVFESLTKIELSALGKHFTEVSFAADTQFVFEGEHDPSLYVLVDGEVEVFTKDDRGNEIHIAFLKPVESIGEMGYFQEGIRTASVRSTRPTELLNAKYTDLTDYFENVPRVALAFLDVINQRQKKNNEEFAKTLNTENAL